MEVHFYMSKLTREQKIQIFKKEKLAKAYKIYQKNIVLERVTLNIFEQN